MFLYLMFPGFIHFFLSLFFFLSKLYFWFFIYFRFQFGLSFNFRPDLILYIFKLFQFGALCQHCCNDVRSPALSQRNLGKISSLSLLSFSLFFLFFLLHSPPNLPSTHLKQEIQIKLFNSKSPNKTLTKP